MPETAVFRESLKELKALAPSGFALGFHVVYTTPTFLFQAYSPAWQENYSQKGYLMRDPTVHWGFENVGTVRWSELKHLDAAGIFDDAAAYGLNFGVTCAFEEGGTRSFGGFSRPDAEFTDAECATLLEKFTEIHKITAAERALSQASVDVLEQLSVGYTNTTE